MSVIFEQNYLAGRVVKIGKEFNLQFSVLGGKTISLSFDNEMEAKLMYGTLEEKYLEALNKLQEAVLTIGTA